MFVHIIPEKVIQYYLCMNKDPMETKINYKGVTTWSWVSVSAIQLRLNTLIVDHLLGKFQLGCPPYDVLLYESTM